MIAWEWIQTQVLSLTVAERKTLLGRQRLRLTTARLLEYLEAVWLQSQEHRHFSWIYAAQPRDMAYNTFMHGVGLVAKLMVWAEQRFREAHGIAFDHVTIADSSLLPSKESTSITAQDWEQHRATVRPGKSQRATSKAADKIKADRSDRSDRVWIAGEKWLTVLNSQHYLVYTKLMDHINVSDVHAFRHPMGWYRLGLGLIQPNSPHRNRLIVDRGFSNKQMRKHLLDFAQLQPKFQCDVISPYHAKERRDLTPEEWQIYAQRWAIETAYQQIKDPLGSFRLTMKGVRRRGLRQARVAMATLLWNMRRWEVLNT